MATSATIEQCYAEGILLRFLVDTESSSSAWSIIVYRAQMRMQNGYSGKSNYWLIAVEVLLEHWAKNLCSGVIPRIRRIIRTTLYMTCCSSFGFGCTRTTVQFFIRDHPFFKLKFVLYSYNVIKVIEDSADNVLIRIFSPLICKLHCRDILI